MSCLFEVCKKNYEDLERVEIFAVRDDKNGYPHFLIYEDKEWKYIKAKHFMPVEEWYRQ